MTLLSQTSGSGENRHDSERNLITTAPARATSHTPFESNLHSGFPLEPIRRKRMNQTQSWIYWDDGIDRR